MALGLGLPLARRSSRLIRIRREARREGRAAKSKPYRWAASGYRGVVVDEIDPRPRNVEDAETLVVVLVVEVERRKDVLNWGSGRRREVKQDLCKCRGPIERGRTIAY